MPRLSVLLGLLALGFGAGAFGLEWSEPHEVRMRRDVVVTYRAAVSGDWLLVEAQHAAGWHTYAMDNVVRARVASGKEKPECELPTRIAVSGALSVEGTWRQSKPADLSNAEIKWYTFGFEETSYFAVKVAREEGETATVRIDAQACNASSCSMVDGLEIVVGIDEGETQELGVDLESLVEVVTDEAGDAAEA